MKSHHEGQAGVSDPGCSCIPVWEGLGGMGGASPSLRVGVLQPALVLASSAALAWRGLQRLNRRLPMETWCVYPLLFQGA